MRLPDFLTAQEAVAIQAALPTMSVKEKMELFDLLEERERRAKLAAAQTSLLGFAHLLYPGFKEGAHHRKLAEIFEAVIRGEKRRVIINIAPRMGKSEFSSYLFPSYFLGKFPHKRSSWVRIRRPCQKILVGASKICFLAKSLPLFFLKHGCRKTKKRQENGLQPKEGSITP